MFLFHFLIGVRVKSTLLFVGAATVLSILVMVRSTLAYTHCPYANDPSISQTISHRPTLTVMPTSTLTSFNSQESTKGNVWAALTRNASASYQYPEVSAGLVGGSTVATCVLPTGGVQDGSSPCINNFYTAKGGQRYADDKGTYSGQVWWNWEFSSTDDQDYDVFYFDQTSDPNFHYQATYLWPNSTETYYDNTIVFAPEHFDPYYSWSGCTGTGCTTQEHLYNPNDESIICAGASGRNGECMETAWSIMLGMSTGLTRLMPMS